MRAIDAESDRATQSLQQALEYGDLAKSAKLQQEIAALETRRGRVQDVAEQLHRTPPEMLDPVGAFPAGRCMRADRPGRWLVAQYDKKPFWGAGMKLRLRRPAMPGLAGRRNTTEVLDIDRQQDRRGVFINRAAEKTLN